MKECPEKDGARDIAPHNLFPNGTYQRIISPLPIPSPSIHNLIKISHLKLA